MKPRTLAIVTALALVACYASTLRGMANIWMTDEDMGHGFLVPIVVAWIVWRERDRWRNLPAEPSLWGFVLLAAGATMQLASAIGVGLFAGSAGMVLSIAGVITTVGGYVWLRALAFPLLLSLFMLPKLAIVYNQATLPLQLLATRMAAGVLSAAGFAVSRDGNILGVSGHRISVIAACDGIRYLLPMAFTAVVFAYISDAKWWMRVALPLAVIPVVLVANALRVALAATVPAFATGTLHAVSGWTIFVLCLPALAVLRHFFNFVHSRVYA
jgi:exosortase